MAVHGATEGGYFYYRYTELYRENKIKDNFWDSFKKLNMHYGHGWAQHNPHDVWLKLLNYLDTCCLIGTAGWELKKCEEIFDLNFKSLETNVFKSVIEKQKKFLTNIPWLNTELLNPHPDVTRAEEYFEKTSKSCTDEGDTTLEGKATTNKKCNSSNLRKLEPKSKTKKVFFQAVAPMTKIKQKFCDFNKN